MPRRVKLFRMMVEQIRQRLSNISAIATKAGTELSRTVKTIVLVRDLPFQRLRSLKSKPLKH
jgi:enamine deaminase RidA (YjgF/YER057c/UK114 family)